MVYRCEDSMQELALSSHEVSFIDLERHRQERVSDKVHPWNTLSTLYLLQSRPTS